MSEIVTDNFYSSNSRRPCPPHDSLTKVSGCTVPSFTVPGFRVIPRPWSKGHSSDVYFLELNVLVSLRLSLLQFSFVITLWTSLESVGSQVHFRLCFRGMVFRDVKFRVHRFSGVLLSEETVYLVVVLNLRYTPLSRGIFAL